MEYDQALSTTLGEGGGLAIPEEFRVALGVDVGDEVMLRLDGDRIHISAPKQRIRRAQQLVRAYLPDCGRLSEELIAERRAEAERES